MSLFRLSLCVIAFCVPAWLAHGEPVTDEAGLLEKAKRAFFHLDVTGTLRNTSTDARQGKAFAIGPDLLLTSSHVVGDWDEWLPLENPQAEITRALRPIARNFELSGGAFGVVPRQDIIVMPTFSPLIDATTLRVPRLGLTADESFQLSLCSIKESESYTALMTQSVNPEQPASVDELIPVHLIAEDYDPVQFGGLYVFRLDGPTSFATEPWGHDGSPIFDADFNVVALVSAVTKQADAVKVLATPVQALIPGTNHLLSQDPSVDGDSSARPKCSMVDLVDRMSRQLSWKISRLRDDGELTRQLEFRYDGVTEPPNITKIKVTYWFEGKKRRSQKKATRLPIPNDNDGIGVITIDWFKDDSRQFRNDRILPEGLEVIEPPVLGDGGWISTISFTITPIVGDVEGEESEPIELIWKDLVGERNEG